MKTHIKADRRHLCKILGGLGAALVCLPIIWGIFHGDKFNPVTYFLWSLLSVVCAIVLFRAGKGGYHIMVGYTLSDLIIGLCAYYKSGILKFGNFEAFISVLTIMCLAMYVWCERRKYYKPAVVACAVAAITAGVPQVFDSFNNPTQTSILICLLYILVSFLSYYGDKPTFEARLIPGLSMIYWLVIIIGVIHGRMA